MFMLNNKALDPILIGLLLSVTLGMLLFIVINELYPRVKKAKYKDDRNIGILLGIVLLLLSIFV